MQFQSGSWYTASICIWRIANLLAIIERRVGRRLMRHALEASTAWLISISFNGIDGRMPAKEDAWCISRALMRTHMTHTGRAFGRWAFDIYRHFAYMSAWWACLKEMGGIAVVASLSDEKMIEYCLNRVSAWRRISIWNIREAWRCMAAIIDGGAAEVYSGDKQCHDFARLKLRKLCLPSTNFYADFVTFNENSVSRWNIKWTVVCWWIPREISSLLK